MVYDLSLLEFDDEAQTARLLALVGSGTYARCLAMDIGEALGCGGYAAALRRTRIGPFSVDDAVSPDRLSPQLYAEAGRGVLTLDQALAFIPSRELGESDTRAGRQWQRAARSPCRAVPRPRPRPVAGRVRGRRRRLPLPPSSRGAA